MYSLDVMVHLAYERLDRRPLILIHSGRYHRAVGILEAPDDETATKIARTNAPETCLDGVGSRPGRHGYG